jgi:hypothetical protein
VVRILQFLKKITSQKMSSWMFSHF